MALQNKDLLSIHDLSVGEVALILDVAVKLKKMQKQGIVHDYLRGKTLAMLFSKASTRTRTSFEVGMFQLGGHAIYLSDKDSQLGRGEPVRDTARVLSRYADGIMIRTFSHDSVKELARYASVPVINGLTDLLHPCQALTDMLTMQEYLQVLRGRKFVYFGDGNNMTHSLMFACAKCGVNMVVCCPDNHLPDKEIVMQAQQDAEETGCKIILEKDPARAAFRADVLYTDAWASMGQEAEHAQRVKELAAYQINSKVVKLARDNCIVMHCLPAYRGEEITDEVLEGSHSVVFDEAENRLHVQKAIMALLMSNEKL